MPCAQRTPGYPHPVASGQQVAGEVLSPAGWQMLAEGGEPSWPQVPGEMLFAALSLVAQNASSPYSSSRDMDKQGQSHQVIGQRRLGPWTGGPQGSIRPMRWVSCRPPVCLWSTHAFGEPGGQATKPQKPRCRPRESKQVQGQCLLCMGPDGSMGQSEARNRQESVGLCTRGWDQAGMTKAMRQKGLWFKTLR